MDPIIGGALIGGGATLLGSILSRDGAADANRKDRENMEVQMAKQEMFAKEGLGWRIKDGMKMGLSKLAAAGSSPGVSYSAMTSNTQNEKAGWADAGHDIGKFAFQSMLQKQQMEGTELDHKLKEAEIGKLLAETDAIANPVLQNDINTQIVSPAPAGGYAKPNTSPDIEWAQLPNGVVQAQKSTETATRLQDDTIGNLSFQMERAFGNYVPPRELLPYPYTEWDSTGIAGKFRPASPDPKLYKKINPVGWEKHHKAALKPEQRRGADYVRDFYFKD